MFDGDTVLKADDLVAVLEAARWAATWGHRQPVRFLVGLRGDETITAISELLKRGNSYAKAAGALIMVCADEGEDERTARYAAVDAGAAIAQLTIEAVSRGLIAHPMAGFNADGAARGVRHSRGCAAHCRRRRRIARRLRQRATGDRRTRCAGPRETAAGGGRVRGTLGTVVSAVAVASAQSVVSSQKSVVSRQFFLPLFRKHLCHQGKRSSV